MGTQIKVGLIICKQKKAEKRCNRQLKSRKFKSFQKSRNKQKVNRPDLRNPTSFSLDFSLELFFALELFGGGGHRTDRQNRDLVKVIAAEYLAEWIYIHFGKD